MALSRARRLLGEQWPWRCCVSPAQAATRWSCEHHPSTPAGCCRLGHHQNKSSLPRPSHEPLLGNTPHIATHHHRAVLCMTGHASYRDHRMHSVHSHALHFLSATLNTTLGSNCLARRDTLPSTHIQLLHVHTTTRPRCRAHGCCGEQRLPVRVHAGADEMSPAWSGAATWLHPDRRPISRAGRRAAATCHTPPRACQPDVARRFQVPSAGCSPRMHNLPCTPPPYLLRGHSQVCTPSHRAPTISRCAHPSPRPCRHHLIGFRVTEVVVSRMLDLSVTDFLWTKWPNGAGSWSRCGCAPPPRTVARCLGDRSVMPVITARLARATGRRIAPPPTHNAESMTEDVIIAAHVVSKHHHLAMACAHTEPHTPCAGTHRIRA